MEIRIFLQLRNGGVVSYLSDISLRMSAIESQRKLYHAINLIVMDPQTPFQLMIVLG